MGTHTVIRNNSFEMIEYWRLNPMCYETVMGRSVSIELHCCPCKFKKLIRAFHSNSKAKLYLKMKAFLKKTEIIALTFYAFLFYTMTCLHLFLYSSHNLMKSNYFKTIKKSVSILS